MRLPFKRTINKLFFGKPEEYKSEMVQKFYECYEGARSLNNCSLITNIDINECEYIKDYLYENNLLGAYVFEKNQPPQKYMREQILLKYPHITKSSNILEIGPGVNPIFSPDEYPNWYGIDKYADKSGVIHFQNIKGTHTGYTNGRLLNGCWENISDVIDELGVPGKFDLLVSSHSYEHVYKPIQSLNEAARALKKGGNIVLFVPNGYSDEPHSRYDMTHTLFLVPEMIEEFFRYSGCYKNVEVSDFRMNYDFMIFAERK